MNIDEPCYKRSRIEERSTAPTVNHDQSQSSPSTRLLDLSQKQQIQSKYAADTSSVIKSKSHHLALRVFQLTLQGAVINLWSSYAEAATVLNIKAQGISACVCGKQKKAGGFKWAKAKYDEIQSKYVPDTPHKEPEEEKGESSTGKRATLYCEYKQSPADEACTKQRRQIHTFIDADGQTTTTRCCDKHYTELEEEKGESSTGKRATLYCEYKQPPGYEACTKQRRHCHTFVDADGQTTTTHCCAKHFTKLEEEKGESSTGKKVQVKKRCEYKQPPGYEACTKQRQHRHTFIDADGQTTTIGCCDKHYTELNNGVPYYSHNENEGSTIMRILGHGPPIVAKKKEGAKHTGITLETDTMYSFIRMLSDEEKKNGPEPGFMHLPRADDSGFLTGQTALWGPHTITEVSV